MLPKILKGVLYHTRVPFFSSLSVCSVHVYYYLLLPKYCSVECWWGLFRKQEHRIGKKKTGSLQTYESNSAFHVDAEVHPSKQQLAFCVTKANICKLKNS